MTHSLVGYDRETERVAEEFDVPDVALPRAKALARVPADDPEAIRCYPLDASGAQDLADMLKARIDTERRDYFLEGFVVSYALADDAKFREDPYSATWSVWMQSDADNLHVKVTLARKALDDYASKHGHSDRRAVIDLLNARMRDRVQQIVSYAINDGRVEADRLVLNERDVRAMLDE
jgi:hypothetical protein